eukprot:4363116-Pyramimonas_sp.AAC.1
MPCVTIHYWLGGSLFYARDSCHTDRNRKPNDANHLSNWTTILLIRMNPDEHYTNEGVRVPSCFKYDKKTRVLALPESQGSVQCPH